MYNHDDKHPVGMGFEPCINESRATAEAEEVSEPAQRR